MLSYITQVILLIVLGALIGIALVKSTKHSLGLQKFSYIQRGILFAVGLTAGFLILELKDPYTEFWLAKALKVFAPIGTAVLFSRNMWRLGPD